jgi:FKBP-type peptidyl-prolyl cis-trans isomerase
VNPEAFVATSRRRERELARRRFERRRQAELERRARAKRRNTVLGAVLGTVAVIVVLVIIGVSVFGGSNNRKTGVKAGATPTASVPVSPSPTPAAPAPKKCAKISPDPTAKGQPSVPQVTGKVSNKLVTHDVKVGHGPAAKSGGTVNVFYIGVSCTTGKVFDASYLHQPLKPFPVTPLGQASVIAGWNQGLIGIRAGGVRELVIPAKLAYQDQPASAPTGANDTLIFLVTAKSVSK